MKNKFLSGIIYLKKTAPIVFLMIFTGALHAQEVLTTPAGNAIVKAEWQNNQKILNSPAIDDTLELPIFDDFAKPVIYPDPAIWLDKKVYINRNYPINPISVGVATFDGVSETGLPYDTGYANSGASLAADTLTSKPINLDFPNDSVYLSFFYQPMGNGDLPDEGDSLMLEFKSPAVPLNEPGPWTKVWAHDGYSPSKKNGNDTVFQLVMLKLDRIYLKKGFQFRFRNKATPGNDDQWHIDYIKLDRQRLAKDTIFNDVAFVYNPSSLLKNYEAMPWNQYTDTTETRTEFTNYIRNNDIVKSNTYYEYTVKDPNNNPVITGGKGSADIEPYSKYGYTRCISPTPCPAMFHPLIPKTLPRMMKNTTYTVTHIIKPPGILGDNDTLTRKQVFQNYYAYDDGTAELAYGLNAIGAKLAYQFKLNVADTLRAIDMYFHWMPNDKVNNISQREFRITVWADNKGEPGEIIFQDKATTPHYQYVHHKDWGNLTNFFYRYKLSSDIKVSGTIYVGWVQSAVDLLNIGFDKSGNSQSKLFYNTQGNWNNSQLRGNWMIRPVFGTREEVVAVKEMMGIDNIVRLYPNPAKSTFYVDVEQDKAASEFKLLIYDAFGRVVIGERRVYRNQEIDIAQLPGGFYFVRIIDNKNNNCIKKLVVTE